MRPMAEKEVQFRPGEFDPAVLATEAVKEFVCTNTALLDKGATLRLQLCLSSELKRSSSKTNREALERLLSANTEKEFVFYEEKGEEVYLNFEKKIFEYRKRQIHLTALEKLSLYKHLCLNDKNIEGWAQIKRGLRVKFGKGFLKGLL